MGKEHIIELNGQRYDARTGAIVATTPIPASKTHHSKPVARTMDGFSRAPKQSLPHHQPEKSKTLMRAVVAKPKPAQPHHQTHSPIKTTAATLHSQHRHAASVQKSPLVSRFGHDIASNPKASPVPDASHIQDTGRAVVHQPASADPISHALANATGHEQPKLKKARLNTRVARKLKVSPRVLSSASFGLAFLLITGFFAYQNIPGLTMRLAAARSGVQGRLPGYQPAGFSLNGSIAYKPGQITINYKSNSDDRNFKVSQSSSSWDSQSLLDNYVAVNRRDYQTVQDKGKTVYIYDGSNATWVDGGIWYRVEGESSLNSDQLLHIAASL